MKRDLLLAAFVLGLAGVGRADVAHAAEHRLAHWRVDSRPGPADSLPRYATVRSGALARLSRTARSRGLSRIYRTPSGEPVQIEISPAYGHSPATVAAAQSFANFLASRLHGQEITRVRVLLAPPAQIGVVCPGALACYASGAQMLLAPGEDTPSGEAPKEYVVTHEYGHHIARNRSNFPWPARYWGPKYWASVHRVCEYVRQGLLFPGGQNVNYLRDPGEAWAESYALYHYPGTPWRWTPLLRPFSNTRAAVRADVLIPWTGRRSLRRSGVLFIRGAPAVTTTIATPLDGRISVSLSGPARTNFNLELLIMGKVVDRTSRPRSRDTLQADLCGPARIAVRVRRMSGAGRFQLHAQVP